MLELVLRSEARIEILEAQDWYEAQAPGLGVEFARAVDAALALIQRYPEAFVRIDGERRRTLLRRFPYQILYRITEPAIVILACFHHRRDPSAYSSRR